MRVLYVDDEPDIREIARLSLELDPEMTVAIASSGSEAVAAASSWRPDVILLDVMMPEMDGQMTLDLLKKTSATCDVPVIFVTARTQAHEVERFRKLGALAVIPKPFDPMTFAAQVRALHAARSVR